MTLFDAVRRIERAARAQLTVKTIVGGDIYRLNTIPDAEYGVFCWTQGQHYRDEDSDLIQYRFTFFYVDRLTHDKRNELEIQSVGIRTLSNIIARLEDEGLPSGQVTFDSFTERFTDECAGVMASVTFSTAIDFLCADSSGDFNDDFNDDFNIG